MKSLLPITLLALAVLGCGRFQSGSTSPSANANAAETPAPAPVKAIDFPAIFGRSLADVKKMVNAKITYESKDSIDYELPQGNVSIDTRKSVNKRISFNLQDNVARQYNIHASSPQQLATFVGIDLAGKTPTADNDTFIDFDDKYNGEPVRITVMKIYGEKDAYQSISVESKAK